MPGLNQRGPLNEGPMTGGARGTCTNSAGPGQGFAGRGAMGYGPGMRGGRGRRGCRWQNPIPPEEQSNREILQGRADRLEKELAAVKQQIAAQPDSER